MVFCDWLNSHSILFLRFIHVIVWFSISFLFMANNTSMYGYITFCLSIHQLRDTGLLSPFGYHEQCCYENLCTCFCVNTCFHIFWYKSGNAGSNDNSAWCSEELRLFQMATPLYILTSSVWVFYFPHSLTNTCYFLVFVCFSNHLSVCEVVSDAVGFGCISLLKTLSMLP